MANYCRAGIKSLRGTVLDVGIASDMTELDSLCEKSVNCNLQNILLLYKHIIPKKKMQVALSTIIYKYIIFTDETSTVFLTMENY
jgi:hypothetical protein